MALPQFSIPTDMLDIEGQTLTLRGLTRGEIIKLKNFEDEIEGEIWTLATGLELPLDEVRAWYDKAPTMIVQKIVKKIVELSGLDDLGNA